MYDQSRETIGKSMHIKLQSNGSSIAFPTRKLLLIIVYCKVALIIILYTYIVKESNNYYYSYFLPPE